MVRGLFVLQVLGEAFYSLLQLKLLLVGVISLHAVNASLQLLYCKVLVIDDLQLLQRIVVQLQDLAVQVTDCSMTSLRKETST